MTTAQAQPPGKRGRGRPPGSVSKRTAAMQYAAKLAGDLPHEFLLRIQRGERIATPTIDPVTGEERIIYETPTLEQRIDAAKAAAPYFAPKLATVDVFTNLKEASDADLLQIIADAATAAGVVVSAAGDGEAEETQKRTPTRVRIAQG